MYAIDRLIMYFFSFALADKEVIGYYEDGMRVPEDITLLWSDDK